MPYKGKITKTQIAAMYAHVVRVLRGEIPKQLPIKVRTQGKYVGQTGVSTMVGNSLRDAGIYEGDIVIFEITKEVYDGQFVAALTPEGFIAKFFYREPDWIRFESRNSDYLPLRFLPNEIEIVGVVREISRVLNQRRKEEVE